MSEEKKVNEVVKETVDAVKDTAEKTVEVAKDTVEKTVEVVKDTAEKTVEVVKDTVKAVEAPARSKKATWWNRIWSAIVGAIVAIGAMFGITTDQVKEQVAKTEQVKVLAAEALTALKSGDIKTATAKLKEAGEVGKDVAEETKNMIDTVKDKLEEAKAKSDAKAETVSTEQYKK